MDKTDNNLLKILMENSRIATTRLAKHLRISREVAAYRLNRLKKEGVIQAFITQINIEKLGFVGAAVFVTVKTKKEKEFKEYLATCDFVSWVAELSGTWTFGFSVYGKNNADLDEKFLRIYTPFKDDILDHRFTLHRKTTFYYEKYLNSPPALKQEIEEKEEIDEKDKLILKELSSNARIDSVALAKKVSLSAPAVSHRIKQLEHKRIIEKYSLFLDISHLHLYQYSIFISNRNIQTKRSLLTYVAQHPNVSFIAEYVGDPFFELGIVVKDPYALRAVLQQIEQAFPDNRIIEVSLFQKEFISIGPPACVFENTEENYTKKNKNRKKIKS